MATVLVGLPTPPGIFSGILVIKNVYLLWAIHSLLSSSKSNSSPKNDIRKDCHRVMAGLGRTNRHSPSTEHYLMEC
jgi:hypothetical protein